MVNTPPTNIYIVNKNKETLGDYCMLKGFVAGLVILNGYEWFAHKYLLHGVHRKGKPRYSPVPKSRAFLMIVMSRVWTTGVRAMS